MTSPTVHREILHLLSDPLRSTVLKAAGETPCHLVGGAVRDRVALGRSASDWDLIVLERGLDIAHRLATALDGRLVILGRQPLVAYRVAGRGRTIDIWDRRGEDIVTELERRDLTINSIAIDLGGGTVEDPQGGLTDIENRVLRCNAPERFDQDPLRVLRLLRFTLLFPDFDLEHHTESAARTAASAVESVARERIREELDKSLGFFPAPRLTGILLRLDLFPRLWDDASTSVSARFISLAATDEALADLISADPSLDQPSLLPALRHAVLLRSLARVHRPTAERTRYEGELLDRLLAHHYVSRATGRQVQLLLAANGLPLGEVEQRRFIHRFGPAWPVAAALAATSEGEPCAQANLLEELRGVHRRWGAELFDPPRLLSGTDLEHDFGIPPGKTMGRILRALEEAQVEGAIASSAQARAWLKDRLASQPADQ